MDAIDATRQYRRPCGTNEIRPAVILQPSSPRPRSRAPPQSTPRTVADAPATLQEVALAIAACPAVPDPNVADPPSHHPPSRCCDNQLNPPNTSPSDTPSAALLQRRSQKMGGRDKLDPISFMRRYRKER